MRIRRLKSLILFGAVMTLVLGAGIALRNIALGQVRKAIEATFHYQKIRVRAVPPAVILEDVRTVSSSPFFSAEKIVIQISTRSLFRRDRPLRFVFDRPVVRLYARQDREPKRTASPDIRLPFAVESAHIRDGEVFYWGPGVSLLVKGVRAFFHRTGEAFLLRAECDEHDILLEDLAGRVMGRTSLMLEGRGDKLTLQRLTAQGPDYLLRARGVISNPRDPAFEIRGTVRGPVGLMADALDLPFRWDGAAEGSFRLNRQAGRTTIRGSFASDDLALNEMALGRTAANVDLPGDGTGRVDLQIRRRSGPTGYIDISFGAGRVQGEVRGVHLDPVLREVHVPWPVRSPAWGRFTLDGKALKVEGEFRDDLALEEPGRFPFRGRVALDWDGGRRVDFSSDGLESNFGSLSVGGGLVVGGDIGIDIRGDVSDVPRARDFVSRLLGGPLPIPEIRGRGTAEVRVQGRFDAPSVRIGFDLAPAGFDRFDTAAASGVVDAGSGGAAGWVRVRDPDFRSDIRFHAAAEEVGVSIDEAEGLIERLLPPLGVDLPLTGRASGRFEVRDRGRGLEVGGAFAARSLLLAGLNLREASGRLEYSEESQSVSLSDIAAELAGGRVEGGFGLGLASRDFSCDLAVGGLALENLAAKLRGSAGLRLRGRGHLDRDEIGGPFEVRGLGYAGTPPLEAAGTLSLDFRSGRIDVRAQGAFEPGRNDFELLFRFPEGEGSWFASAKGSLFNLDQLIPWPEAKAEIRYLAEARSGRGPLQLNGVVELAGSVFPIPGFAHALTDFSGLVTLQSGRATVRSLQAKLGGGDVFGSGEVRFGAGGLEEIDLRADGRDMALSLFERTRARADGSFRLVKDRKGFFLSGDVDVRQLAWRRDVAEKLEFAASPYPGSKRGPGFLDDLALDIRLRGEDNVVIDNSLGRIEGRFDLTIAGTVASPVILGDIEGLRGSVRFQDRNLRILRARLSFFNPVAAEPFLDFRGETYLKNYRVTFSLAGVPSKLRPEFSSSPPLPPEDVLALLALGESFKRTYSVDASAGVGTGALISGQLTDEAKKQAERLFRLDRFRIDPFVLGSSTDMTARLTVGKKISRDVIVLYSTNLTSQREEIVRLEWEISESFSLVAMRDEFGRLSVDAKIRRRF